MDTKYPGLEGLSLSTDGVDLPIPTPVGQPIELKARDIRRERTGVHAKIGIFLGGGPLAFDSFNVSRSEERQRLVKAAHKGLSEPQQAALPLGTFTLIFNLFCLWLSQEWELQRVTVRGFNPDERVVQARLLVRPYVLDHGGTIFFGPPEAGKTYVLLLMALCLVLGDCRFWDLQRRPVCFVNLERPPDSVEYRLHRLCAALQVRPDPGLFLVHGRDIPFSMALPKLQALRRETPEIIFIVDSLSRIGAGSLTEDDVARSDIALLNSLGTTWIALGHTPRGSGEHLFGSMHFDAAADIMVSVKSERQETRLGVSLEVTKGNDIARPPMEYLSFGFGADGLDRVGRGQSWEYPELVLGGKVPRAERVKQYLEDVDRATADEIAAKTSIDARHVRTLLQTPMFQRAGKDGRATLWGLTPP